MLAEIRPTPYHSRAGKKLTFYQVIPEREF